MFSMGIFQPYQKSRQPEKSIILTTVLALIDKTFQETFMNNHYAYINVCKPRSNLNACCF